jgi:hypothetical protein
MAFLPVVKTYVEKIDKIINQFTKYHLGIVYKTDISLAILKAKRDAYDNAIDARNKAAAAFSEAINAMYAAQDDLSKQESSFLLHTGSHFTKDSNEYVWAGGIRQSESNDKRKATVEENQRLAKQRLEEETARIKAEKEQFEAEMVALKAEVERLRAERDAK